MSIEEKLLTIIKLIQYDYRKYADPKNADERIEQIIQAFEDDGWVQMAYNPAKKEILGKPVADILETTLSPEVSKVGTTIDFNLMTGQEWYDRFVQEWLALPEDHSFVDIQEASKRASGIEETK